MHGRVPNLVLVILFVSLACWAADRQAGIWKLNVNKSKFPPEYAVPKNRTLNIQEQPGGIKTVVDGVEADGKILHVEYSAKYDGKDYPMHGLPSADTITIKRINASTFETTNKKEGKLIQTIRSVISKDGKTRTTFWNGHDASGRDISWTMVYEKQ
jgi:hypothetical protein